MTSMMVIQKFHPVGTGTFKTGSLRHLGTGESFQWVYDCGATSKTTLNRVLSALPRKLVSLDMLVLSHFDNDHVNGVETLLRHCSVKTLVLPYSEWAQSVREISVLGKKGSSPSTAMLQLNPVQWLASRNFDVRVEEVVFIRRGPDATPVPSGNEEPEPNSREFQEDEPGQFSENYFSFGSSLSGNTSIRILPHNHSIQAVNGDFEFVFYNAEKDFSELGLIEHRCGQWYTKHSGWLLSDVKKDIQNTIMSTNLHQPLSGMPANWRKTLKDRYEYHFGHSGKAKNNISLCMYAAPVSQQFSICCIGSDRHFCRFRWRRTLRPATLCTGDIHLTAAVISDIQHHLGAQRWNRIGLMQVPHHGSQHSWEPGNAVLLAPTQFVHCASGSKHHPHPDVQADLSSSRVHCADRTQGVIIRYRL